MLYKRILAVSTLSFAIAGCAVPHGGAVLSYEELDGCGFVDQSSKYNGRFIRVTDDPARVGRFGGQPEHQHSFAHIHDAETEPGATSFQPLGLSDSGSSGNHFHKTTSSSQTPTLTSSHPNNYSNITFGLFVRENFGSCIPRDAIVGYAGTAIPDGWREVNGIDGYYISIAEEGARARKNDFDSTHSHSFTHEHEIVVFQADPNDGRNIQVFQPQSDGTVVLKADHGHLTGTVAKSSDLLSSAIKTELPYTKLRFIAANERTDVVPRKAILLMTEASRPDGWVRLDLHSLESIVGHFLRVAADGSDNSVSTNPSVHAHNTAHEHRAVTRPTASGSPQGTARDGIGSPLTGERHVHSVEWQSEEQSQSAHHLPPYVEFHIIMKK